MAASLVWIDPHNESAEIDPLRTHPDCRRRSLARAILAESFRRMWASGLRYAYIGADATNHAANHLHAFFQSAETYDGHNWVKGLD